MAAVDVLVRARQIAEDIGSVVRAVNREIVPVLSRVRTETNLLGGDIVTADGDYSVRPRDGVVLCQNTASSIISLPPPDTAEEKRVTVIRKASAIAISDSSGGTISGAAAWSPAQWGGHTFISDGSSWYVAGSF